MTEGCLSNRLILHLLDPLRPSPPVCTSRYLGTKARGYGKGGDETEEAQQRGACAFRNSIHRHVVVASVFLAERVHAAAQEETSHFYGSVRQNILF